jgi:hypothetical protein
MGRKHRIEYSGAIYHVIQRGNNKSYIVERQIIALTNCITRSKYSYKIKIT